MTDRARYELLRDAIMSALDDVPSVDQVQLWEAIHDATVGERRCTCRPIHGQGGTYEAGRAPVLACEEHGLCCCWLLKSEVAESNEADPSPGRTVRVWLVRQVEPSDEDRARCPIHRPQQELFV